MYYAKTDICETPRLTDIRLTDIRLTDIFYPLFYGQFWHFASPLFRFQLNKDFAKQLPNQSVKCTSLKSTNPAVMIPAAEHGNTPAALAESWTRK